MNNKITRESLAIYPSISMYNTQDIDGIWTIEDNTDNEQFQSSIYVHIPFCPERCEFCNFTAFSSNDEIIKEYVGALKKEIKLLANKSLIKKEKFNAIYFGGGTPTILKINYLEDLISTIFSCFVINKDCEFTVEVRPGREATEEKLTLLKKMGVNRISIGAQSFDQNVLDQNGRNHKVSDFYKIYERLRKIGFLNINIDVMSGMIFDNEETWEKTINCLLELSPENISVYKMKIHENNNFYKKYIEYSKDDKELSEAQMIKHFYKRMFESGYELSSHSYCLTKSKQFDQRYVMSRNRGDQRLGIGLAANSFFNRTAYQNTNDLNEYFKFINNEVLPIKSAYKLTKEEEIKRALIYGIKSFKINRIEFQKRYGIDPIEAKRESFERMLKDGVIEIDGTEIRTVKDLLFYVDDIARNYILSEEESSMEFLTDEMLTGSPFRE